MILPTTVEVAENRVLSIVAASILGGSAATAIQESVFSNAAAAEGGKQTSRTNPDNLSTRVFNSVNKSWRPLIKGSRMSLHSLKRKNLTFLPASNKKRVKREPIKKPGLSPLSSEPNSAKRNLMSSFLLPVKE